MMLIQLLHPDSIYQFDSWGYLNIANNLFEQGVYSREPNPPLLPDSTRTPLYPLFLYLFYFLNQPGWAIIFIQAILSSLTACLVFSISQVLRIAKPFGIVVALLFALDPVSIFFTNTVLTETLFTFLFTLSMYYFIRSIQFHENGSLYASAVFIGLATLCRPVSLYLIPLLAVVYFISRKVNRVFLYKQAILYFGIVALFIGPWFLRNKMTYGQPFFSSISEINLLHYTVLPMRSALENKPKSEIREDYETQLFGKLDFENDSSSILKVREFAHEEAIRLISGNPVLFGKMALKSALHFFLKPLRSYFDFQLFGAKGFDSVASVHQNNSSSYFQEVLSKTSNITLFIIGFQLLLMAITYLFILLSLKWWYQHAFESFLFISLAIAYFAFTSTFADVDGRFRLPVIPILLILAAPGFGIFMKKTALEKR